MDKNRVIVFLILSLGIIFGYEYLLKELGLLPQPTISEPAGPSTRDMSSPSNTSPDTPTSNVPAIKETAVPPPPTRGDRAQEPRGEPSAIEVVEVETDLYRAKFT
ncbi:MAG TPA: hypothetical protein VFU48_13860, partial [Nitrospira sp.]|nr:hypothetical protein [Nitrospira sp.]